MREEEKQRQQILQQVADGWLRKSLLKKCFTMFKKLRSDRKLKEFLAEKVAERKLKTQTLNIWISFKMASLKMKEDRADKFYKVFNQKQCLKAWMNSSYLAIRDKCKNFFC